MAERRHPYRLWTPIANALEVYRRRLIADPDAVYEHMWRIVHIEEAMVVLLGSALVARLLSKWHGQNEKLEDLNDLRCKVTGLSPAQNGRDVLESTGLGCWQGSIGAWTDVLNVYGKEEVEPSCEFCKALGKYLCEEPGTDIALIDAWQRISPVPIDIFKTRIGRLKAINNLRNKLAHVPVSEKLLRGVHRGLRQEILGLLSPDEGLLRQSETSDIVTIRWHPPLYGRICTRAASVTGSDFAQIGNPEIPEGDVRFDWGKDIDEPITWQGSPLVHVDGELKVALLFRAESLETDPGERDCEGEYYRFAAEIEPAQKLSVSAEEIQAWLPEAPARVAEGPTGADGTYVAQGERPETETAKEKPTEEMSLIELREAAEEHYRARSYGQALPYFTELRERERVSGRTPFGEYNHVRMLHHGESLWKTAEWTVEDTREKTEMLRQAVEILGEAADHRNISYQARAHYQRSKAHRRLWISTGDDAHYAKAKEDAADAARLAYEPGFVSWYERVMDEDPSKHE